MATEVRRQAEYAALRATIRERGTARLVLVPIVFIAWAAAAIATAAAIHIALSSIVPLLVLAAGFEAVFALHTNVERIGRYVQVFHEEGEGWEHVAMELGRSPAASGADPLFARLFSAGVSVNFLSAALGGSPVELLLLAVFHLFVLYRIHLARKAAAVQRDRDLERFTALRDAAGAIDSGQAQPE